MNLLGIDFETTGLDPETEEIIELGAVVWDSERHIPVKLISEFVKPAKAEILPHITKITGITPSDVELYGWDSPKVILALVAVCKKFDIKYFVAHNAVFDRSFLESTVKALPAEYQTDAVRQLSDIPWICTKKDIPYPDGLGKGDLLTMAAKHGFLNPFPHRGCTDTLTCMKLFSMYDWDEIMKFRESPMLKVISLAPFSQKDEVKEQGFYWDAPNKKWTRELREVVFNVDKENWNFRYKICDTALA